MKTLFHTSILLFIAISQCMILGRPRVSYGYSGRQRTPAQLFHRPQSHVFTRARRSSPSRYHYGRGLRFAPRNRSRYQRRAELMNHGMGGQHSGENHHAEYMSHGNYNHFETVEITSNPSTHGSSYLHNGPDHSHHDESVEGVVKHLMSVLDHTPLDHPISIDRPTVKTILGLLKELKYSEGQSGVLKPSEEYELKIKDLTERIQHLEKEIAILEKEEKELLAGGHKAEAQAKEHEIHDLHKKLNDLQLELDKAEDVHYREGIQTLDEEEQRLEAEGGHDGQLADLETDKADLEVHDAGVDEDIKHLEIEKLSAKIAELQDQKAHAHDEIEVKHIQEQIDNLKREKAAISADKQITGELRADIAEDERKITELNAEKGHEGQVASLLRAKRMLKKAVRRLEDEDAEIDKEECEEGCADKEYDDHEHHLSDEEEIIEYMTACESLYDLNDSFYYVAYKIEDLYHYHEFNTHELTEEFREEFNSELELYAKNVDLGIDCILKYYDKYQEHPEIKDFLKEGKEEIENPEILDKIKESFDFVFSEEIMNIIENKVKPVLLHKIIREDDVEESDEVGKLNTLHGRFKEIGEGDKKHLEPSDAIEDMIENIIEADDHVYEIFNEICEANDTCDNEHDDHHDDDYHDDDHHHDDDDEYEDYDRIKLHKRMRARHHIRRVKHRRQLRRSNYRILRRY